MKYTGSIVMVTGAAKGIGRAIALAYGKDGARVVGVDKDGDGLLKTQELVQGLGARMDCIKVELSDPRAIEDLFTKVQAEQGRLDILINNAGLGVWGSPYDLTVEQWDYVINTNLRGTFLCSREAAKLMRPKGGSIVNISSTRSLMSEANSEAYAASKGGLVSLTHALALSLGPDGISVNCISPGWIELGNYQELRQVDHHQHPAGRVGKPEDIARACLYLTNPDNDFVTGSNLVVDGGMTRKMIYED